MSAPSPRPNAFLGIGDDLLGELRVAFSSLALDVVIDNRFPKTWCFCQAYIPRNHALKDLCSKKAAQISGYLSRKRSSFVIHCKQDPFDFEARVQRAPDTHERVEQLGNALEGQVLALNRNEHSSSGYQRIQGEKIQGWRTVQQDESIFFVEGFQRRLQLVLAIFRIDQLDGSPSQILIGGGGIQPVRLRPFAHLSARTVENQYVIKGFSRGIVCEPDGRCSIRLGIAICQERGLFGGSEAGS